MSTEHTVYTDIKPLVMKFMEEHMKHYIGPLYHFVKDHPELINVVPGFLLNPEKIIAYVGRTHIALEYTGPEVLEELEPGGRLELQTFDYSTEECNLFEKIIGFSFDSTASHIDFPLPLFSDDLILPTNKGVEKLSELGWLYSAQNYTMGFNIPTPHPIPGKVTRVVNGIFFDANDKGLLTRRIKWLDFIPIIFDGTDDETDSISFNLGFYKKLIEHDATYKFPIPEGFKYKQLPKINRFIELWGNNETTETQITSHLNQDENKFILTMKFGAINAHSELSCEWQSENKKGIRPDFFIVQPNGYADIVEFKLPNISTSAVVGSENRETFSAWLNSYISQTRVYSIYFDDPNNRKWFEEKYGFKVYKPRRFLVVGRRADFKSEIWREIQSDYSDVEILTFDDLIDGVSVQFYKE